MTKECLRVTTITAECLFTEQTADNKAEPYEYRRSLGKTIRD